MWIYRYVTRKVLVGQLATHETKLQRWYKAILPHSNLYGKDAPVKRSANGRPPGPGPWYSVYFHRPGPGVLPSSPLSSIGPQSESMSTPPENTPPESAITARLQEMVYQGREFQTRPELPPRLVEIWVGRVRAQIRRLYGPDSEAERSWPPSPATSIRGRTKEELGARLTQAERLLGAVSAAAITAFAAPNPDRIFIGHGRSPAWREVKDFLQERLGLAWEEFNRESAAGIATTERLEQMLSNSSFAFLVMTAEDEHTDLSRHARPNVIHEVGLFQGRLGSRRAVILLEEGWPLVV